jgi:hypothetical protein
MASRRELTDALDALCRAIRSGKPFPSDAVSLARAEALVERSRRGLQGEIAWSPFVEATPLGMTYFEKCYVNSRYQVLIRPLNDDFIHLSIKRIDQAPIRSWRDLQRIKNELVGVDCEAIEIFPADSRLTDESNQYHLYACTDPAWRVPFGASERTVAGPEEAAAVGARQEPFES